MNKNITALVYPQIVVKRCRISGDGDGTIRCMELVSIGRPEILESDNSINGQEFGCQYILEGNKRILDVIFTYRLGRSEYDLVKDRIRADNPDQRYIPQS